MCLTTHPAEGKGVLTGEVGLVGKGTWERMGEQTFMKLRFEGSR